MVNEKLLLKAGILEEFWPLSLDDLENESVRNVVKDYIQNLYNARDQGIGLFFHGTNGGGKTMAGVEVLKAALEAGYTAQFASLGGIVQVFADGWTNPASKDKFERRIRDVDFLMIDDVGKEMRVSKSGLIEVVFDNVIRYRTFRNKPLILTTNSDIDAIETTYGKSVISLLRGKFLPVKVVTRDYREEVLSKTVLQRLRGE